jgi:hypothetical protein
MAASKRKRQRKADKKARQERAQRERDTQTSAQALHQRDDRHVLVAMTLASLVAGLLAIVNLDRTTHADSLTKEERVLSTSRHGWPLVYLERDLEEKPQFFHSKRLYPWPVPAVEGEQRRWNFGNLVGDLALGFAITVGSYALISFLVRRYDQWKKSLRT